MEQLNFNFGLGGALPKGYTLSSYTFGQAINTIDIESVNIARKNLMAEVSS